MKGQAMSSIEKEKLAEVQLKISGSDLREAHKDAINDMLMTAGKATNGVQDKPQALTEAMAALAICFARDALYRREDFRALMDEALAKHTSTCPLAKDGNDGARVSVKGQWGKLSVPAFLWVATMGWSVIMAVVAIIFKAKGWA